MFKEIAEEYIRKLNNKESKRSHLIYELIKPYINSVMSYKDISKKLFDTYGLSISVVTISNTIYYKNKKNKNGTILINQTSNLQQEQRKEVSPIQNNSIRPVNISFKNRVENNVSVNEKYQALLDDYKKLDNLDKEYPSESSHLRPWTRKEIMDDMDAFADYFDSDKNYKLFSDNKKLKRELRLSNG